MMPKVNDDGSMQFGVPLEEAQRVVQTLTPHCEAVMKLMDARIPDDEVMQISVLLSSAASILAVRAGQTDLSEPDPSAMQLADFLVSHGGPVMVSSLLARLAMIIPQMNVYALTMKAMDQAVNGDPS